MGNCCGGDNAKKDAEVSDHVKKHHSKKKTKFNKRDIPIVTIDLIMPNIRACVANEITDDISKR